MRPHPNRKVEPERGSDPSHAARVLDDDEIDRMIAEQEALQQGDADVDEEDDIERPPFRK